MNFKKIILFLVVSAFFCAGNTLALEKAVFPNQVKMQPIPEGVVPNISGNVNWHANKNTTEEKYTNSKVSPALNAVSVQKSDLKNDVQIMENILHSGGFLLVIICLLIFIIFTAVFIYASKKRKLLEKK